ncbi:MAG: lysophospholipid acyltransferase family protein, partial [bacterium]|nr:lysophospholipid acyltransferase family protein [bacterium]
MAQRAPLVMITWHGRMMVPTWHMRKRRIVAMISRHADGEMAAQIVERLGFEAVRGSSTRGGSEAALDMLERVKAGQIAAMICDGPRGPAFQMKSGAPFLALRAGAFVIPATFAAEKAWIFKSWDRFQIPKPFARVHLLYGDPIPPQDSQTDLDRFTRTLESALNDLTSRADALAVRP